MQHQNSVEFDNLRTAAHRVTSHLVKARARHYMRRPGDLEALYPGLSMAPAGTLIAITEHLVERERQSPRRWFGFGGEVSLTNAQAALLLGRVLRYQERRLAGQRERICSEESRTGHVHTPSEP